MATGSVLLLAPGLFAAAPLLALAQQRGEELPAPWLSSGPCTSQLTQEAKAAVEWMSRHEERPSR
jgi:hypothetical protein